MDGWNQVVWSFPALVFTVAAGALVVYFYAPSWRLRRIPGPLTYGLLGNLPLFDKNGPEQVLGVLASQYGSIYRFYMGRQPVVVVADPDLCREVGIKKFKSLVDRSTPASFRSSPIHYKSLLLTKMFYRDAYKENFQLGSFQPSVHMPIRSLEELLGFY